MNIVMHLTSGHLGRTKTLPHVYKNYWRPG